MSAADPESAALFGEGPIEIVMLMTFKEDGTLEGALDLEASLPAIREAMKNVIVALLEAQGMSLEDLEDAGMSLDDLVDQSMGQLNPEDLVPADDMSGSYAVDGDKIIINGQNENYFTRVGDTLVLSADGIEIVFTKR